MNNTIDILMNHMSVRKFTDEAVSRETVNTIVQCAQMAPTSSHFQAYSIIEVQSPEKRKFLADAAGGQKWVTEAPLVLFFLADLNRGTKYYKNIDKDVLRNTESYTVSVIDASLAAEKALIAAQSLGLGGVVVGGIRNDVEGLTREFKLPDMVAPLFLLVLGYPAENPGVKPRLPQEEVHKIDFYDDSKQEELLKQYDETVQNYYMERSGGKINDTWTERCGTYIMAKTRYEVGHHFRKIGFLKE